MPPALQAFPVVATDDEDEFVIGIIRLQMLQSGPRIGRLGEGDFIILCYKTRFVSKSLLHQEKPFLGIGKGPVNLERVLRTDHKPYLIETLVFKHPFAYGNMSVMNGIKGTPKKSYSHTINERITRLFIV